MQETPVKFIIPKKLGTHAGGFYVKVFVIHRPCFPQLQIDMGECELQAHSVTANRGGEGGGNLISDTKMYTAAAVAAVPEERG